MVDKIKEFIKEVNPEYHELLKKVERGEKYLPPRFLIIPGFNYDDGKKILIDIGMERPLTIKETIQAIVESYESNCKSSILYNYITCTGIIGNREEKSKFKIIPVSQELINEETDLGEIRKVNYSYFDGEVIDIKLGKYEEPLTKTEVLNHPAWQAILENDKSLLKTYTDIIFNEIKNYDSDKAMSFFTTHERLYNLNACYITSIDKKYFDQNYPCSISIHHNAPHDYHFIGEIGEIPRIKKPRIKKKPRLEQKTPSLYQILKASEKFVPEIAREEFKKEISKLYKI